VKESAASGRARLRIPRPGIATSTEKSRKRTEYTGTRCEKKTVIELGRRYYLPAKRKNHDVRGGEEKGKSFTD